MQDEIYIQRIGCRVKGARRVIPHFRARFICRKSETIRPQHRHNGFAPRRREENLDVIRIAGATEAGKLIACKGYTHHQWSDMFDGLHVKEAEAGFMADSLRRFIYECHTQEISQDATMFNDFCYTFPSWLAAVHKTLFTLK